jgi:uncharacterized protein (UPF0332 family)
MTTFSDKHSTSFTRNLGIQSRPAPSCIISTAYYALFHLLISEAVANWNRVNLRAALGRAFDHNIMKATSNRIQDTRQFPFTGEDPTVVASLKAVAKIFAQLQEKRHIVDYDHTTFWTRTEALAQIKSAEQAFATWKLIRNEQIARVYLVSLVVKKRD